MDKDIQDRVNRAVQAGADPQEALRRASILQQQRQNQSSVLSGDIRSGNLVQNNGLVGNLINTVARPFVRTGQTVGGSAFEVARSLLNGRNGVNTYEMQNGKAKYENPFLSQQQVENPNQVLGQQLKNSAAIASYGIPLGGATKLGSLTIKTSALGGGALAGGLQSLGEDDATAEDVLKGAVVGGTVGKAFELASNIFGKFGKTGKVLENAGADMRTGKVNLKASISGAADEKASQAVLKRYGIKGTPQARYDKLQPVMDGISNQIDSLLGANAKAINPQELESIFLKKVSPYVRQGDITLQEAKDGLQEYISSVQQVTPEAFADTKNLFSLKKDLQAGMQTIYNKNGSLTSTQKSIKAIRDTFDELITKANPEVKQLTMDQSRLFDAVKSISAARKTVPTVRALGITIPKGPYNAAVDTAGKGVEAAGKVVNKAGQLWPGVKMPQVARQALPRLASLLQTLEPQSGSSAQVPQTPLQTPQNGPQELLTPEVVQAAYFVLPKQKADLIAQLYQMQSQGQGTGKKTESEQARSDSSYLVNTAIDQLAKGTVRLGPIAGKIEEVKSIANAGDPDTIAFNRTISSLKATIAKMRAGTSFTPNEERLLDSYTPAIGDSYQQTLSKLQGLQQFLNRR